ncbi:MAG TPA: sulfatase-like hydrolase/transferase, partial [Candidatus Binatia bacterium]|nr:sulfatase-like hydrolase/transferase [Candidatus Binatia bacterium]
SFLSYRAVTGVAFDGAILWYHFTDAFRTVFVLGGQSMFLLTTVISIVLLHYRGLLQVYSRAARRPAVGQKWKTTSSFFGYACLGVLFVVQVYADNGVGNLVIEFRQAKSDAKVLYVRYFEDSIKRNKMQSFLPRETRGQPNLFFVQLESLNADLVNPSFTPRLTETARKHGIFFPRIQSSSVFTILAMETILCSVLPTLERNLAQSEALYKDLVCLPKILKRLGFRTLYFQAYPEPQFNNMDAFLQGIGFDEVHARDLMKPEDKLLKWGYAEDVFYRRVFHYLERFKDERVFAYVLVGSANHYPFFDEEHRAAFPHLNNQLPFPNPKGIQERMANTTFIQDYFFGRMYDELYVTKYSQNSHMVVFGDHSWPVGIHDGNTLNLNGAFQENFVTSLAVLPAKNHKQEYRFSNGKEVRSLHSHLDLLPTILEMYRIHNLHYYGQSFFRELIGDVQENERRSCVLSVQPFAGGFIALIDYPIKQIFDLKRGLVTTYDLQRDPSELKPMRQAKLDKDKLDLLNSCLASLKERRSRIAN